MYCIQEIVTLQVDMSQINERRLRIACGIFRPSHGSPRINVDRKRTLTRFHYTSS